MRDLEVCSSWVFLVLEVGKCGERLVHAHFGPHFTHGDDNRTSVNWVAWVFSQIQEVPFGYCSERFRFDSSFSYVHSGRELSMYLYVWVVHIYACKVTNLGDEKGRESKDDECFPLYEGKNLLINMGTPPFCLGFILG